LRTAIHEIADKSVPIEALEESMAANKDKKKKVADED
jgi:hypothetical protein